MAMGKGSGADQRVIGFIWYFERQVEISLDQLAIDTAMARDFQHGRRIIEPIHFVIGEFRKGCPGKAGSRANIENVDPVAFSIAFKMILQQLGGARGRQIAEPFQHRLVIGCRPIGIKLVGICIIVEGIGAGKKGICLLINIGVVSDILAHAPSVVEIGSDNKSVTGRIAILAGPLFEAYTFAMGRDVTASVVFARAACIVLAVAGFDLIVRGAQAEDSGQHQTARIWRAGLHTFSDELGGFSIVDVRGSGTKSDPVIITQDFTTVAESVLTIRPVPVNEGQYSFSSTWTALHLQLNIINRSPASWIGFRFELQEELGKASIYGDGLSFNQLTRDESGIVSSRFAKYEIEHEPGDRLVFNDGWVDQSQSVLFSVFLLDLTPGPVFYIEQLPHLPAS